MMVRRRVRIETLGISAPLDDFEDAHSGEGEKGPIDRVKRDARTGLSDFTVDGIRARMIFGSVQSFENSQPLGREPQVILVASIA